jgi:TonB family protein
MSKIIAVLCFAAAGFAQTVDQAGITVDAGAPLLHRVPVFRMPGVTTTGDVILDASVDSKGQVTDARVLSGPLELRRAALQSVLEWHYSTEQSLPPSIRVAIHFGDVPSSRAGAAGAVFSAIPSPGTTIGAIEVNGVTPEIAQMVRDRIPVHVGDQASPDTIARARTAAREIDEHFQVGLGIETVNAPATLRISIPGGGGRGGVAGGIVGGVPGGVSSGVSGGVTGRIMVDQGAEAANLITKVNPTYPPLAKQARIQGVVQLNAVIGADGTVKNLQVISGHPLLVPAALEAVKQWVYRPTLQNGNPVEVATQITVNFTLSE